MKAITIFLGAVLLSVVGVTYSSPSQGCTTIDINNMVCLEQEIANRSSVIMEACDIDELLEFNVTDADELVMVLKEVMMHNLILINFTSF